MRINFTDARARHGIGIHLWLDTTNKKPAILDSKEVLMTFSERISLSIGLGLYNIARTILFIDLLTFFFSEEL